LLRGEWSHERRERLKVAQDIGDGFEWRLEAWRTHSPLEGVIAPWATCWHIYRQALQTLDNLSQWERHLRKNGYLFVERRQILMLAMQPGWPIASREVLQPREVSVYGDNWQRRRKEAKRCLLRAPDGSRQSRVAERPLHLHSGGMEVRKRVERLPHHTWSISQRRVPLRQIVLDPV
jgi:hypothetical protein